MILIFFFRLKKSFLGVHFLENPNDAITIAEVLHDQNIDLVIETGTYRGAAALFFASVMYQYRYNATEKAVRPFKVITMDVSPEAKTYIDRYPLLAAYIIFIPHASVSTTAKALVNLTYTEMKPINVFISLDGDHYAQAVYDELVYYQNYVSNIGNYILVQDTRLSSKWHTIYCASATFDGPCNGPQEGVNWFLKHEGQQRFNIDLTKEYLFSTHHKGWLKRIAH
jgi:cephalosporin hydroxylase